MATRTVVRRPSTITVRMPSRAGRIARRAGGMAARAALSERHTLVALAASGVLGFMQARGTTLPHVAALGEAGTYGLGAWMLGRMTKSPMLQHSATGLLAVQVHDWARQAGGAAGGAAPAGATIMGGVL